MKTLAEEILDPAPGEVIDGAKPKTKYPPYSAALKERIRFGQAIARQLGPPLRTSRDVAAELGISNQAVLKIEALALHKIAVRLQELLRDDVRN